LPFMRRHTAELWSLLVADIDHLLMLKAIEPLWATKNDTARRVMHQCSRAASETCGLKVGARCVEALSPRPRAIGTPRI
jgi:hypothetical protein